jgi:shikimate dehydrogenase
MKVYGLIGFSLSHSFSKKYFEKKFGDLKLQDVCFNNYELANISHFQHLMESEKNICGLSVTNPYKESIMPLLHDISDEARRIGAVNCVQIKNQKYIGHNTDVFGFAHSIKPFLDPNHQKALILGTGGASKAVAFALQKIGIDIFFATGRPQKQNANTFLYSQLNQRMMESMKLVVNTTPLGTFPKVEDCPPIPYDYFTPQHLAYDLVYNPAETTFLQNAAKAGAITVNGLSMLHWQAEKAWEIWQEG